MAVKPLKDVVAKALELPEGGLRDFYLESACAGDPAFRAEVEGLLREHTRLGGFLATSPGTERHGPTVTLEPGSESAFRDLAELLGGLPRVLLRDAGPVEADTEPVAQTTEDLPATEQKTGRYELLGEIARGGHRGGAQGTRPGPES